MSLDSMVGLASRSPFTLDIDPESLRTAARKMRRMAAEIERRGTSVRAVPAEIASGWTGKAARETTQEVTALGKHLARFVKDLDASREAVLALARTYEDAEKSLKKLNARWDAALDAQAAAVERAAKRHADEAEPGINPAFTRSRDPEYVRATSKAANRCATTQDRVDDEYEALLAELRKATRTCARALRDEVPLPVDRDAVAVYRGLGAVVFRQQRPRFTADMPLSGKLDRSSPPRPDVSDVDPDHSLSVTDRLALTADLTGVAAEGWADVLEKWGNRARVEQAVAWDEYRARGGASTPEGRAARRRAIAAAKEADINFRESGSFSKFGKRVPLVGYGLTGYDVAQEIRDGEDPGYAVSKAAVSTGAGAAAGAAVTAGGAVLVGVAYTAGAPVTVPVTIGVLAVGASIVASKAAEDWFTRKFGGSKKGK